MVALEFDVVVGTLGAVGVIDSEREVMVAVASVAEKALAGIQVGEDVVGWEGGFGQFLDFGPLILSVKSFAVLIFFFVREVREDIVKEQVGLVQLFDDVAGFLVEYSHVVFFVFDDFVVFVLVFWRSWAVGDWGHAG